METTRIVILRVHGTLLIAIGFMMSIVSTLGLYGTGPYSFLSSHNLGHVGLIQAYLLACLTGIVLWMGSHQEGNKKKWNRIGALFHFFILVVYVFHWNFFATLPNGVATRSVGVSFHILFLALEGWAGSFSK
ncbi:hypothetical protein [Leptospira santarosai]|uniref:Uncharacterized protein n=1 Tax=Leptospira santarosai str. MOR084 TaxID=1049984 RepID=A0A0E2BA94_9LEPT|nr:hypothetical protein [Leptospira santarosai]EKO32253.1 hypothetical protein LEP1GSC179_4053 [Leptospira santarosai str. MOR084]